MSLVLEIYLPNDITKSIDQTRHNGQLITETIMMTKTPDPCPRLDNIGLRPGDKIQVLLFNEWHDGYTITAIRYSPVVGYRVEAHSPTAPENVERCVRGVGPYLQA